MCSGRSALRAMSLTARRPPGLSTRKISRKTAGLSGARLSTQLLMTQSDGGIGERKAVDAGEVKFDIGVAAGGGVGAGALDHGRCHVDADGAASGSDLLRGEEHVEAAAAAEIDDYFAGPEVRGGGGIAAGEAHVGFRGNGGQLFGGIAEGLCDRFDARLIAGECAFRDCAVFGFDGIE